MIGSIIDKYEVLQKLGEGATATVYRGRHLTIGKDVAIKVLHPHLSASSRYRERFNREARAVGRLSHQNIVSILDYSGQGADDCYIVTELVDGVTLQELLHQHGRLPSEIAAIVGADLADALAFAHREGIIHRDIKPENVMIRRDGRVKLMDFGVARVMDEGSITLDGSLLGSPAYMSPQQALDEPLDGRSDLFSLGTVLFHALTGHVPFSGGNASVILRNIIEGNRPEVLELAPDASPSVAAVIDRLMQQRAEDRYASAEDSSAALRACLAEVRIAGDHPTVNLRNYVVNPEGCTDALLSHLRPTLMEVGRERLADGDHLGALQLFNRLLAMDEENGEVISLIQSLHSGPDAKRRPRWIAFVAAAALLVVGGTAWWTWGQREDAKPPPAAAHVEAAKVEPAPAPATPAPAAPAPTGPREDPAPPEPVREPVAKSVRAVASSSPAPAAAPAPAALPARVILEMKTWADIYLDGKKLGSRGRGNSAAWVGTQVNPILVEHPGEHVLEARNDYAESAPIKLALTSGEERTIEVELTPKPVPVMVHPTLPLECRTTIGPYAYGGEREIPLRDRDPAWKVVISCPGKGDLVETLGPTQPGVTKVVGMPVEARAEP
ncbi:MAG: serine/threonine-protein kinase [Myxococcota bacterium]